MKITWFHVPLIASLYFVPSNSMANECVIDEPSEGAWVSAQNERTWSQYGDGFWLDDFDRDQRRMDRVSASIRSLPTDTYIDHYVQRRRFAASWWITRQRASQTGDNAPEQTLIAERDVPSGAFVNRVECNENIDRCVAIVSMGGQDASSVWLKQYNEWHQADFWPSKSTGVIDANGNIWFTAADSETDQTQSGYPRSFYQIDVTGHTERLFHTSANHIGIQVFELNGQIVLQEWLTYSHTRYWFVHDQQLHALPIQSSAVLRGFDGSRWYATLRDTWRDHSAETLVSFRMDGSIASDVKAVFVPNDSQTIDTVRVTNDRVWLSVLEDVSSRLFVIDATGDRQELFASPDIRYITLEYADEDGAIVRTESPVNPPVQYRIQARGDQYQHTEVARALSGFDSDGMVSEQYFATSHDGTLIPYFIVRDEAQQTPQPTVMWLYGGFSMNQVPKYLGPAGGLWVAEGGSYVVANVRGGAEYGAEWHRSALRRNKRLTIEDTIAVADDLVQRGLTSPSMLGLHGASNGGLMALATAAIAPEKFAAVAAAAPLTDMLNFPELGVGATWIEEYGDPKNPQDSAVLRSYSPLHNVTAASPAPAYFISVAANDDRVGPEHARRFAERLDCLGLNFYYWEVTQGGHSGVSNYDDYEARQVMTYQFFERWLKEE